MLTPVSHPRSIQPLVTAGLTKVMQSQRIPLWIRCNSLPDLKTVARLLCKLVVANYERLRLYQGRHRPNRLPPRDQGISRTAFQTRIWTAWHRNTPPWDAQTLGVSVRGVAQQSQSIPRYHLGTPTQICVAYYEKCDAYTVETWLVHLLNLVASQGTHRVPDGLEMRFAVRGLLLCGPNSMP